MNHNESIEDYLETILVLSKQKPVVRSVDIANEMGFKKPSISVAVKNMKAKGYILVSDEGYITFTKPDVSWQRKYMKDMNSLLNG